MLSSDHAIAAIVLAAGASSRMQGHDKLKMQIDGQPLLQRSVARICQSNIGNCVVVVRDHQEFYENMLADLPCKIIVEPNAANGMSVSMNAGIAGAGPNFDGYLICLADMPDLTKEHFNQILSRHEDGKIIRPKTPDGRFGHPVLFDRIYFDGLQTMSGDEGARALIKANKDNVVPIEMDGAIINDLDTPDAWEKWRK